MICVWIRAQYARFRIFVETPSRSAGSKQKYRLPCNISPQALHITDRSDILVHRSLTIESSLDFIGPGRPGSTETHGNVRKGTERYRNLQKGTEGYRNLQKGTETCEATPLFRRSSGGYGKVRKPSLSCVSCFSWAALLLAENNSLKALPPRIRASLESQRR